MIEVIEKWRATRSGAFLTIVGERNGKYIRLPGVIAIEEGTPHPVAIDRSGNRHHLAAQFAAVTQAAA